MVSSSPEVPENLSDPVALLQALIACPSVTPEEGGALDLLEAALRRLGFAVERIRFSEQGTPDVENLVATIGEGGPHLMFAGHTDVVPPGDADTWRHPPFSGVIDDGLLYGRGAVDMKGGVAAFVSAIARLRETGWPDAGRVTLLITGDEEGPGINGTDKVLGWCESRGMAFDAALVGEPTNVDRLGDMAKVGRRGSLSGTLGIFGRQGHAAYPHRAQNPMPAMLAIAQALTGSPLDQGSKGFQPSNLEIVSVDTGNRAFNVIPGRVELRFNVRFNDTWTSDSLKDELLRRIHAATPEGIRTEIGWERPAEAFFTRDERLAQTLCDAVAGVTGQRPELSTAGGSSDARFVQKYCPVIEFGLVGDTMHQVDERVPVADVETLTEIYRRFVSAVLTGGEGERAAGC
ncbi:succinyl-diaminopimelate desuccinylase [Amorphus sp. 3PC139-8]|uniref:succinyl-diaminopimelate desuccinylase n=1 Tax=Amorphus sp. 3PC139-8 TaxID=2735676 RepID=UPI00345D3B63